MDNFNILNLWPNYLSQSKFEGNIDKIRDIVLTENYSNPQTNKRTTTVNGIQPSHTVKPWDWTYPEWAPIKEFVQHSIEQYVHEAYPYIKDLTKPRVVRSWTVTYNEGGYQEPHCHPQLDLSALLILQTSNQGGEIVFTNPALQSSYSNFQPYSQKFRPEAGVLLIWPAWLLHYSLPTQGPLQKIVMSFDISLLSS